MSGSNTAFTRGENPLRADKLNTAFSERVLRTGDRMSGPLLLMRPPSQGAEAANKQYVDDVSINSTHALMDDFATAGGGGSSIVIPPLVGDGIVDDAEIIRHYLGDNTFIMIPPGTWYFKSRVVPILPVQWQCSTSVTMTGLHNCHIMAYGARFICDDSISGPDPAHLNCGMSHFGFQNDCHNCSLQGGVIVGNRKGLPPTTLNSGVWFESVTNLLVRDVTFEGDYTNGSAINGVYAFDSRFIGNHGRNVALGFDTSHLEACTFSDNVWYRDAGILGSTAIKIFTDPNTTSDNVVKDPTTGAVRPIRNGQTNDVKVMRNRIIGYPTGILIDGVRGIIAENNTIRDGCYADANNGFGGIVVIVTPESFNTGIPTRDVQLLHNDITNCGNTGTGAGGGVLIACNNHPMPNLTIHGGHIYDNAKYGVEAATVSGVTGMTVTDVDFRPVDGSGRQGDGVNPNLRFFLKQECVVSDCIGTFNDSYKAQEEAALVSSLGTAYYWNDGTNQAMRSTGTFYVQNIAGDRATTLVAGPTSLGTDLPNYINFTGNFSGQGVNVLAEGVDTDVTLDLLAKGNGSVRAFGKFYVRTQDDLKANDLYAGASFLGTNLQNWVQITGNVAGQGSFVSAAGGDINIDLNLATKGTGKVNVQGGLAVGAGMRLNGVSPYANNAAAIAAGHVNGDVYFQTTIGALSIVVGNP